MKIFILLILIVFVPSCADYINALETYYIAPFRIDRINQEELLN